MFPTVPMWSELLPHRHSRKHKQYNIIIPAFVFYSSIVASQSLHLYSLWLHLSQNFHLIVILTITAAICKSHVLHLHSSEKNKDHISQPEIAKNIWSCSYVLLLAFFNWGKFYCFSTTSNRFQYYVFPG